MEGKVKWFAPKKGYGFIETEEGKDVFVHHSAIKMDGYRSLNKGDKVRFETAEDEKGIKAQDVVVIEAAPVEGGREGAKKED